jgi:tetratricopeptide (TPR) repeat protein
MKKLVMIGVVPGIVIWFSAFCSAAPPGAAFSIHRAPGVALTTAYNALEDGRWVEAWKEFQSVSNCSRVDFVGIYEQISALPHATLREQLVAADACARADHYAEALDLLDRLISTQPPNTLPYDLKAMVLLQSNKLEEAAVVLGRAPAGGFGNAHNLLLRAYVMIRQGRQFEAQSLFDHNWSSLDNCFLAWNMRGFLSTIQGKHGDGLRDFERAFELNPEFAPASENLLCTSVLRSSLATTNLTAEAAKGLLGASGSFNLQAYYDQRNGFGMNLNANGNMQLSPWLSRAGLFARSDATREDARAGDTADLQTILAGDEPVRFESPGNEPSKLPSLSCPLLIWP